MFTSRSSLPTAEALKYAGLDPKLWDDIMQRQLYPSPTSTIGGDRLFEADDLVTLEVLSELMRIGVVQHIACRMASDLRNWLRKEKRLPVLHLIAVADPEGNARAAVVKRPPATNKVLWVIFVEQARRLARKAIAPPAPAETWTTENAANCLDLLT